MSLREVNLASVEDNLEVWGTAGRSLVLGRGSCPWAGGLAEGGVLGGGHLGGSGPGSGCIV